MNSKIAIVNNLPSVKLTGNWLISYKTHLEIEGRYVLKFKTTMLMRGDNKPGDEFLDVKYSYQVGVNFGFFDPGDKNIFYDVVYHCYQTSVIEFNKTLDNLKTPDNTRFFDASFITFDEVKKMADNSLNSTIN